MSVPTSLVIFGASGDLAHRKLIPALFRLHHDHLLPEAWEVMGFGRKALSDEEFREGARGAGMYQGGWAEFAQRLFYQPGDYASPEGYRALAKRLDAFEESNGVPAGAGERLYYLATPPDAFPEIVAGLGAAGLNQGTGPRRIVVEKPFGHDLASARALNEALHRTFREDQVYRIDHYLAKETVQNILTFRLGNGIFEPLWNRNYVENVQLVVAETLGVEGRGAYYDHSGAIRDIVQNHLLQLLALTAMEPPGVFAADSVRNEKVKALLCIRPLKGEDVDRNVVRGQYEGYRQEAGVAPDSKTETYVAIRLEIDSWRWAGVPFLLRTGKALAVRETEISIQFRQPPLALFAGGPGDGGEGQTDPTVLTLRIQPDEGITLRIGLKPPGPAMRLMPVDLDFSYERGFGAHARDAYERLLLDALAGDPTLFIRADEVEASWAFIDPILQRWAEVPDGPEIYPRGSWGPGAAQELGRRSACDWRSTGQPAG